MIRKSFQLIRTNTSLTTNVKLVVTSEDMLYLESFNSSNELNDIKYKHYLLSKDDYLEDKIPYFYDQLPVNLAFATKYDNDSTSTYKDYSYQFDTLYFSGADKIEDTWYSEEFEYFAPLYIRNYDLPTNFIILRVDDPSNYSLDSSNNFQISSLTNKNFYSEIIDKWKCIDIFDLTTNTNIGKFLDKNYTSNPRFPSSPFYFDARRTEFSNWSGMDYDTGVFTEKDFYLEDTLAYDQLHFRFEKLITDGYKNNKLIFPNIINLKFLFDDTPATPDGLRKYSMNRYYGFYTESMDFVGNITSYKTPDIKPGLWLINNIIVTGVTGVTWDKCDLDFHWTYPSVNPFIGDIWDDNTDYYIFLDNTDDFYRNHTVSGLYPVKKVIQNGVTVWKIIANEIMDQIWDPSGKTEMSLRYHPERVNMKTCDIQYVKYNILSGYTNDFFIDKYIDIDGNTQNMFGDLYLININGMYHVIKNGSGITYSDFDLNNKNDVIDQYYIQSDWAINSNSSYLEYWIVGQNTQYYTKVSTYEKNKKPNQFSIYRVKFADIKDFDTDRVDSDFSDFDYEQTSYVITPEEKLHAIDYTDTSIPRDFKVEKYGATSQYEISNVSSEYVSDDELFELKQLITPTTNSVYNSYSVKSTDTTGNRIQRTLTDLWRKNSISCKWGFMGSISHSDYAYKLNNSLAVGGVYNRTVDPFYIYPDVINKNLDYFYRIGNFYNSYTGNTVYYKFQSTNIEGDYVFDQFGDGFNLGAYFNTDFDYFTHFFKNKMNFLDSGILYTRNYDKYAVFNFGDSMNCSVTLFKGLKISIKTLTNIDVNFTNPAKINKILYDLSKNYNGYKISIILNDVYGGKSNGVTNNNGRIDDQKNGINIIMNEKFQNILIIINYLASTQLTTDSTLNDTSIYNEKDGLYYGLKKNGTYISGYNSKIITAYNFISSINIPEHSLTASQDCQSPFDYIRYYYITEYNGLMYSGCTDNISATYGNYNNMSSVPNWKKIFSPFLISIDYPDSILLNAQPNYTITPYYGPDTRPLFGYSVNEPLARIVIQNQNQGGIYSSSKNQIFRFSGPYEPIFKDINIFRGGFYYYTSWTGLTSTKYNTNCDSADYTKTFNYSYPIGGNQPYQPPTNYNSWENINAMCNPFSSLNNNNDPPPSPLNPVINNNIFSTPYPSPDKASTTGFGGGGGILPSYTNYTQVNTHPSSTNEVQSRYLFVGGFNLAVPYNATISGITVTIKRRAKNTDFISEQQGPPLSTLTEYCYDSVIQLTKDGTVSGTFSQNYALTTTTGGADISALWTNSMKSVTYPDDVSWWIPTVDSLWGTTWTPSDINNPNFGVIISTMMKNNTPASVIIPQIECVTVCVSFTYIDTSYIFSRSIYMDNNLKFDTGLNDFGMIDEFIYSKVNENSSILKINPNNDVSMYPMVDEYGYTYSSRFVFKSPWDKEYFTRTNSNVILK